VGSIRRHKTNIKENPMHTLIRNTALVIAGLGLGAGAHAATITLPLGNVKSGADILQYFNGGADSVPTDGSGPNLGISFSANGTAQKAGTTSTSDGRFENNPSGQGEVLFFSSSTTTTSTLNYAAGFSALSFNYSISGNNSNLGSTSAYSSASVELWSGLNGTGTVLDTLTLTPVANPGGCAGHGDVYCNWQVASTGPTNFGTAESITFGANSTSAFTEFDGLTLTPAPVPLPAAAWLLLSGLASLAGAARRRAA
jgi:hypothetical protein